MTKATVTKLRGDDGDLDHGGAERRQPAPAIGCSVVMNFPGDRQATLQTFFPQEASDDEANALLDRLFALSDRQRAKYDIEDLLKERSQTETGLLQFKEDQARVGERFEKEQAERQVQMDTMLTEAKSVHDRAYEDHGKTGRTGEFEMRGATKANHERLRQGAARVKADMDKQEAEKATALENLSGSVERYEQAIARLDAKIADCRAKIG